MGDFTGPRCPSSTETPQQSVLKPAYLPHTLLRVASEPVGLRQTTQPTSYSVSGENTEKAVYPLPDQQDDTVQKKARLKFSNSISTDKDQERCWLTGETRPPPAVTEIWRPPDTKTHRLCDTVIYIKKDVSLHPCFWHRTPKPLASLM